MINCERFVLKRSQSHCQSKYRCRVLVQLVRTTPELLPVPFNLPSPLRLDRGSMLLLGGKTSFPSFNSSCRPTTCCHSTNTLVVRSKNVAPRSRIALSAAKAEMKWQVVLIKKLLLQDSKLSRCQQLYAMQEVATEMSDKPLPPRSGHCATSLPSTGSNQALIFGG